MQEKSAADEMTGEQLSFAALSADVVWITLSPEHRVAPSFQELDQGVQKELVEFHEALVAQGAVNKDSARSYTKALACAIKQAQRFLKMRLTRVRDLYVAETLAAIAADDVRLDGGGQLSKYSLRQRRVAMRAYLRYVGIEGLEFEQVEEILDEGLRHAASSQTAARFTIPAGRPEGTHRRPTIDEVEQVIATAGTARTSFVGARNSAIFALCLHTGLRASSILAMNGSDFSERRGRVFLLAKQKGTDERVEIEVPFKAVQYLARYSQRFNGYATERAWESRIGFGVDGRFWRSSRGRPLTYGGLLAMVTTYTNAGGGEPFVLHGLRHLRASVLGEALSAEQAALAGHWKGTGVYLRHYAEPLRLIEPERPQSYPPAETKRSIDPDESSEGGMDGPAKAVPAGR